MKISLRLLTAGCLWFLLCLSATAADSSKAPQKISTNNPAITNGSPYKPPMRGAPKRRVDAGTRGNPESGFELYVLTPVHAGLTVREQPTLFWYISKPTTAKLTCTIIDNTNSEPLIELPVIPENPPSFQSISLTKLNVRLALNIDYQWFLSAVSDENKRSKDVVASGVIRRVEPPPRLLQQVSTAGANAWQVYAENGIWYESLSTLSDSIVADPNDQRLRRHRATLLRGVELPDVARNDEEFKMQRP